MQAGGLVDTSYSRDSKQVTGILEGRRTPKYLNRCPLLKGDLEAYRVHLPLIFDAAQGTVVLQASYQLPL